MRKVSSKRSFMSIRSDKSKAPPLKPHELLRKRQIENNAGFNTMEVFDSLPSMYTQEKWAQLQTKRRSDLNFEHLYWLSRFDPQNQDGYHL